MHIAFHFTGKMPVQKYGGTERIVYRLMKELARRGHSVTLIGHPESSMSSIGVKLIPVVPGEDWRPHIPHDADIVHTWENTVDIDKPYINTIEGNEPNGTRLPLNSVFVSQNHAKRHGSSCFVYNGLDLDEYPCERTRIYRNQNFLFLAKGRWNVKNLHDCIRLSHDAKKNLFVAGGTLRDGLSVMRHHDQYSGFSDLLSAVSPRVRYLGMLPQEKKLPIFARTDGFLWPVRWHEPFGIAIIEAMSQGIPVFGTPYGSLPELIPEFCGKLFSTYDELLKYVDSGAERFNAQEIVQWVRERFSLQKMTDDYLSYYERILSGERINAAEPVCADNDFKRNLLAF